MSPDDSIRGLYHTPKELMILFPEIKKAKWEANKIGAFGSSGLVLGKYSFMRHRNVWEECSFAELIKFYRSLPYGHHGDKHRPMFKKNDKMNFLTASELIEKYPIVRLAGWTYTKIGMFASAGLLYSEYTTSEGGKVLIEEESFLRLMRYYNSVQSKALHSHLDPHEPPILFFDPAGNLLYPPGEGPKKIA